jgi:hypothetical protein
VACYICYPIGPTPAVPPTKLVTPSQRKRSRVVRAILFLTRIVVALNRVAPGMFRLVHNGEVLCTACSMMFFISRFLMPISSTNSYLALNEIVVQC